MYASHSRGTCIYKTRASKDKGMYVACKALLSTQQLVEFSHLTNKCFDKGEMAKRSK